MNTNKDSLIFMIFKEKIDAFIESKIGSKFRIQKLYFSKKKDIFLCLLITDTDWYLYEFESIYKWNDIPLKNMKLEKIW